MPLLAGGAGGSGREALLLGQQEEDAMVSSMALQFVYLFFQVGDPVAHSLPPLAVSADFFFFFCGLTV